MKLTRRLDCERLPCFAAADITTRCIMLDLHCARLPVKGFGLYKHICASVCQHQQIPLKAGRALHGFPYCSCYQSQTSIHRPLHTWPPYLTYMFASKPCNTCPSRFHCWVSQSPSRIHFNLKDLQVWPVASGKSLHDRFMHCTEADPQHFQTWPIAFDQVS